MTPERKLPRLPHFERGDSASVDQHADTSARAEGDAPRRSRMGGIVTVVTVILALVVIVATLWQNGNAEHALANVATTNWLWSTNRGEVARVNGATNRVDTRFPVSDSRGHSVQVT